MIVLHAGISPTDVLRDSDFNPVDAADASPPPQRQ